MAFTALMIVSPLGVLLLFLLVLQRISADPEALQDFCVAYTTSSISSNAGIPCDNPDQASPEHLLQDFRAAETRSSNFMNGLPCLNPDEASSEHFMTSALGKAGNVSANPFGFSAILATTENMPGLNALGIAMARADIGVGGLLPLHSHPRGSEIIFVVEGVLNVGFIDTNNRLFSHDLKAGDVFVFPKGTVHYLENIGQDNVFLITAFNSQNPGSLIVPFSTFASSPAIPHEVLAKNFAITLKEVAQIRKNLGGT